jgi:Ser/Thr protein kinase RdoA (MazF antagonist)
LAERAGAHANDAAALGAASDRIHANLHQGNVLTTEGRQRLRRIVEQHVPAGALTVDTAHHGVRLLDWALSWTPDQVGFWVAMTAAEFDRYEV